MQIHCLCVQGLQLCSLYLSFMIASITPECLVHTHIHTSTHTHIHTYTHTYIHTQKRLCTPFVCASRACSCARCACPTISWALAWMTPRKSCVPSRCVLCLKVCICARACACVGTSVCAFDDVDIAGLHMCGSVCHWL